MRDQQLFRRVANRRRIVDHERSRLDVLQQMRRGDIGHVERRILAHEHDIRRIEGELGDIAEFVMTARFALHRDRARTSKQALGTLAAEWFGDAFAFAKAAGLRLTAHAGESMGPESVWAALRLGAERIGHGIAVVRDPDLMRHLRERDIPLEICITSNLVTGVVARIEDHPVRRLYDAGVPITLNTDDPAMFGCTLTGEYRLAARHFGFSEAQLRGIAESGFRYAF